MFITMKLTTLILLWAHSSTAGALQCQTCTDQTCSSTVPITCSSGKMCVTATILATSSGNTTTEIYKACASSSLCPAMGSQTFSVDLGVQSALASATCCNTDNCNSQTLAAPTPQSSNGQLCNICSNPLCNTPIQCQGVEDQCFQSIMNDGVNTFPAHGCASTSLCAAASSLGSLPFMQNVSTIISGPVCTLPTTTAAPTTKTAAPTTTTATPTTTTAGALQCQTCTDQTCSSTVPITCSSGKMCVTATILATSSGNTTTEIYKACASSSLCPAMGSQTFSVDLGVQSALASATCCNTDNCNSQTLAAPTPQSSNGQLCNICSNPLCNTPIQCQGVEDQCFQSTMNDGTKTFPAYGCASTNLCAAASGLHFLPFMQNVGTITSGPTCTSPTTTAAPTTARTEAPTTTSAPSMTTTSPTTITAAPTTITTAQITKTTDPTTTAAASTTITAAPTTTTVSPTKTTTGAATTTFKAPSTTVVASTTTTIVPTTIATTQTTTTAVSTTTAVAPTTTTAALTTTTVTPTTNTAALLTAITPPSTTATAQTTTTSKTPATTLVASTTSNVAPTTITTAQTTTAAPTTTAVAQTT
ncbi:integumentary mucin C.1-like, partial [Haplochromis burtoni]|uniref:integumentary mucin C.1-like n=1 Tax=Haplochromis burtoni TaxID=8153 RepID=UPI001C2CDB82